jgi:hypothetical protein
MMSRVSWALGATMAFCSVGCSDDTSNTTGTGGAGNTGSVGGAGNTGNIGGSGNDGGAGNSGNSGGSNSGGSNSGGSNSGGSNSGGSDTGGSNSGGSNSGGSNSGGSNSGGSNSGGNGGSGGSGMSLTCLEACTTIYQCGAANNNALCPGFAEIAEGVFVPQCETTCASNPILISLVDPSDCAGTISTLSAVSPDFEMACEDGL